MIEYAIFVLLIALEGLFSGSETGFYCLNRLRLRFRLTHGWRGAAQVQRLNHRPQLAISTMLIGTNISVYLATVLCAQKLREFGVVERTDFYSSLIMPPLLLIFAEIIPKTLFQRHADSLMYRTAWVLNVFKALFFPLLVVLRGMLALLRLAAGRRSFQAGDVVTAEKLRFFMSEGTALGVLSEYQQAMADNILRVKSLGVRTAMVPLEQVVMVGEDASLQELKQTLRDHRFSRLPVYGGERESITGAVNVIDVLSAGEGVGSVQALTRDVMRLDATVSVAEALYALQRARGQMAVIVGEGGEAEGIVTVKDLVEEIVGELRAW